MEFLTFCSAGRINLKINTKKQNKIYQRRSVVGATGLVNT
jgi:hypothetical protein